MDNEQQLKSVEQAQPSSTQQSSSDVILIPYVLLHGSWIIDDAGLSGIWQKMVDQNLVRLVFWDESVSTASEWLQFCRSRTSSLTFYIINREVVGFSWLHPIMGNYAIAHFCLFKDVWGKRTNEIGQLQIERWFEIPRGNGEPLLDVIIGMTPKNNLHAQRYVRDLGFERLGIIPSILRHKNGTREDAVITFKTRNPDGW